MEFQDKFDSVSNEWLITQLAIHVKSGDSDTVKLINDELKLRSKRNKGLSKDSQIKIILATFDFDECAMVFKRMGWILYPGGILSDPIIPDAEYLRNESIRKLNEVWDLKEGLDFRTVCIGGGRLRAERSIYEGYKILSLSFTPIYAEIDFDEVSDPDYEKFDDILIP